MKQIKKPEKETKKHIPKNGNHKKFSKTDRMKRKLLILSKGAQITPQENEDEDL